MATAGVMLFKGPQGGVLLFQEAHGVGGVSERAGSSADHRPAVWLAESAGRNTARRFGRPIGRLNHCPGPSAGFSAEILGGGLGWPTPPLAPSLSAEPNRCRASPPFHSDELNARSMGNNDGDSCRCKRQWEQKWEDDRAFAQFPELRVHVRICFHHVHPFSPQVDKVVLVGNNDALVQMAPDSDAPESARYTIRDLSFSCKLLLQMYAQGRGKLIITNPRVSGGQTEVPLGGVAYSNPIQWTVVGTDDVVARLNPRSPLASMADLDAGNRGWQPGVAAAFSFLGTQYPKEVYGSAVAMMPSATFGGVVQLIMAQRVRRVRAAVVGGSEASGLGSPVLIDAAGAMTIKSSRRLLISEAEVCERRALSGYVVLWLLSCSPVLILCCSERFVVRYMVIVL